jgi:uncharacterized lipoprotein YddW (UPF0748 family)
LLLAAVYLVTLLFANPASSAAPEVAPTPLAGSGCPVGATTPKYQFRAMWIATVSNIDWPSRTGLSETAAKKEFIGWLDLAVRLKFNAVMVQVRPGGDAFWPSRYEPWSKYLTGVPGRDPGWDPLAFMVTESHKRNLQFHAWFNPYRVSSSTDLNTLASGAPGRVHPDWLVTYPVKASGSRLYYNPGIPVVRQFVEDAIMDAVSRYDIDGVHFDDFFYPYPAAGQDFPDGAAFAAYGAGFTNRAAWRRHNVDLLIAELDRRIHLAKPWLAFGVSPFGIWRNNDSDPGGSATRGAESYAANAADTRQWVRNGWLDYIVPQLYWNIGFSVADYATLVRWWSATVAGTRVRLYIGQAAYRVGVKGQSKAWFNPTELSRHLTLNRRYPQIAGDIYFSARSLRANRLNAIGRLVADQYPSPALVPIMRPTATRPLAYPQILGATRSGAGVRVAWRQASATSFAVYRFPAGQQVTACDFTDARHLVATVRGNQWTDPKPRAGQEYTYYVTAIDRAGLESAPSAAARTL